MKNETKSKAGRLAALAVMGLMLATAFSGCTGGKNDTGGTGDTGTDDGTGDTGGIGDNQTGGNQTGGNQTIFSDNFDDNKMDPLWKTADCDNDDRTKIEEKEGTIQITAGGIDVHEDPLRGVKCDEYAAVYYSKVNGDFEAIVKVVSLESETIIPENENYYPGIWAKAGIMVRNDISAAGSSTGYAIICISPNYWEFKVDSDDNGYLNTGVSTEEKGTYPCWLKMVKEGTKFTGYYSTDGTNWKEVGNAPLNSANVNQDVGMFACAATGGAGPIGWPEPIYKIPLARFDDFVVKI